MAKLNYVNTVDTAALVPSAVTSALNGEISASKTTITVDDGTNFPSAGVIRIGNEWITYTGKSTNDLTGCSRGAGGTTASIHLDNDRVVLLRDVNFSSPSPVAQAATIAALGTTTSLTAVPGSFADLAAVQTYLADANVIPMIETRLDNIEGKVDALIAAVKTAGLVATS
jgi:hypothetical protein